MKSNFGKREICWHSFSSRSPSYIKVYIHLYLLISEFFNQLQLIVKHCDYWSINSSCNCKRYSSSSSLLSMKWICLANKNNIKYCFVVKRKLWFGRGSYFGVDADFRCVDANFRRFMPFQSVVRLCKAFFHVCLLKFLRAKSGYC